MAQQITVSLKDQTVAAIKALSPDLESFVVEVVEQELARRAQVAALRDIAGMWRDREDIPADTPDAVVDFVRRMRADEEHPPL
ncbi:hypothetical protein [Sulfobacillus harzensis]|uniref:CopG family transcriptional regulator n=1 Tax=Sulfobacillus harzensis TaxID=2729629 RepID=A0A7Y0Q686_9FIRM|nr:hypothetical protein [Sulfobacillus harzensis]NMP25069.1 hypothetical protein [Sulfobacillus harzensis]